MRNDHLDHLRADAIADPAALDALARQAGRQYAMHFVLLGVAGLVAGVVLFLLPPVVALPVAALVVVAAVVPLALFARSHAHLVGQLNRLAAPFWLVYAVACAVMTFGALHGTRGYSNTLTLVLVGSLLALLDGLVVGHFTEQASKRLAGRRPGAALH